jgi:hypothetical protein
MVFASDFGTATGTGTSALRDAGKSRPWPSAVGGTGVLTIVSASEAGLADWPSRNARRISVRAPDTPFGETRFNGSDGIPEMSQDGSALYFRWYIHVPNIAWPVGSESNHNIQGGQTGDNWSFRTVVDGSPTYWAGLGVRANAFPNNYWYPPEKLHKGQTYRIEVGFERLSSTTFNAHMRIYSADGSLLYDDDDFRNNQGGLGRGPIRLSDRPVLRFHNVSIMDTFWAGTNGFPFTIGTSFTYWYDGAYAICTSWCGPYTAAEASF